jgi:photosystem II PsbU protein
LHLNQFILGGKVLMKRLMSLIAVLSIALGSLLGLSLPSASAAGLNDVMFQTAVPVLAEELPRNAAEDKLTNPFGSKIDLNNSNIRAFTKFPGMYPTIAGKIVRNSPYESVEDVFDIPNLSDREKEIIQMHLSQLYVTDPETALVEGGDRYNNGIYK